MKPPGDKVLILIAGCIFCLLPSLGHAYSPPLLPEKITVSLKTIAPVCFVLAVILYMGIRISSGQIAARRVIRFALATLLLLLLSVALAAWGGRYGDSCSWSASRQGGLLVPLIIPAAMLILAEKMNAAARWKLSICLTLPLYPVLLYLIHAYEMFLRFGIPIEFSIRELESLVEYYLRQ